jgi:hypothetical protein
MSTLTLTRPNITHLSHNKLSLHTWDVSAQPFIPRTTNTSSPTSEYGSMSSTPCTSSPEYSQPAVVTTGGPKPLGVPDPVTLLFNRAANQNVHFGNSSDNLLQPSEIDHQHSKRIASSTTTPCRHSSTTSRSNKYYNQPYINKTPLMATTEYFMERWDENKEIKSVTHSFLEGLYLDERKCSNVPSLFGSSSPYPPVGLHQLPSLMSIWKPYYPNQSPSAYIFGAHPEYAIDAFRDHEFNYEIYKWFK